MGCDIHLYVEVKKNGKWISADKWQEEDDGEGNRYSVVDYKDAFYSGRNYGLFAILADVRNGVGFAGVKTGDGFNIIDDPRGIPDDASFGYKEVVRGWDADGHSHSYFTVSELMAFDWTQTAQLQGWATAQGYWSWSKWRRAQGESPAGYCSDVVGMNIKKCTHAEMRLIEIEADRIAKEQNHQVALDWLEAVHSQTYCLCMWEQPYYRVAASFLSECLPRLWRLGKPDDVRIVFFFDN